MLETLGYVVLADAQTGKDAIRQAGELKPDLILMDIKLKNEMNGTEAASQIRQHLRIPVIFMTGYTDQETLNDAKTTAPYGYLVKPFSINDLHTTIEVAYNRYLLEKELAKREEKYRQLFDTMAQGVIYYTTSGQIISVNPAAANILGISIEELKEMAIFDSRWKIILEDGSELAAEQHPAMIAMQTGKPVQNIVLGIVNPEAGKTVWVSTSTVPQFLPDEDQPYQVLTTFTDISESKQAETIIRTHAQSLEYQKSFVSHIIDSIPSSLLVIDRTMRIVSANQNFLEKTHRDLQTTVGHRIEEVFPKALLDYTQLNNRINKVFLTGKSIEGGKVSYHAPGLSNHIYFYRLIPLYQTYRPSNENHVNSARVENVLLLMDDITERELLSEEVRRTERHLAGVVECANELVVSLDPQGSILTWNRAAEIVSGYKSETVKRTPLVNFCAPEHQQRMIEMIHLPAKEASQQHEEINLLTSVGQEIPIAWSCSSMRDDSGKVSGIVVVGRNLADQRRLEEQLIISDKLAALGVMAGGIAHELRNPLGIISASAQLILESPDDAELREQGLQKIDTATKRASLIIENLLKFSRSSWDNKMAKVNLLTILDETIALLAHQLSLNNVSLSRQYPSEIDQISGNRELLQQVFTNLILNACKAMPTGGKLTITVSSSENQVEVQFSDTGAGISPAILPKIFDPFFTTRSVGQGSGLGLSISHSIIAQHHGSIEAKSTQDNGSTFIIRLPASTSNRDQ